MLFIRLWDTHSWKEMKPSEIQDGVSLDSRACINKCKFYIPILKVPLLAGATPPHSLGFDTQVVLFGMTEE